MTKPKVLINLSLWLEKDRKTLEQFKDNEWIKAYPTMESSRAYLLPNTRYRFINEKEYIVFKTEDFPIQELYWTENCSVTLMTDFEILITNAKLQQTTINNLSVLAEESKKTMPTQDDPIEENVYQIFNSITGFWQSTNNQTAPVCIHAIACRVLEEGKVLYFTYSINTARRVGFALGITKEPLTELQVAVLLDDIRNGRLGINGDTIY